MGFAVSIILDTSNTETPTVVNISEMEVLDRKPKLYIMG